MAREININCDMAEGFGAYDIGNDEALLKIIGSANVACGFHAGDPTVMHRFVMRAKEEGVSIGAHPGFQDLQGFGRRQIHMKASEIEPDSFFYGHALKPSAQRRAPREGLTVHRTRASLRDAPQTPPES